MIHLIFSILFLASASLFSDEPTSRCDIPDYLYMMVVRDETTQEDLLTFVERQPAPIIIERTHCTRNLALCDFFASIKQELTDSASIESLAIIRDGQNYFLQPEAGITRDSSTTICITCPEGMEVTQAYLITCHELIAAADQADQLTLLDEQEKAARNEQPDHTTQDAFDEADEFADFPDELPANTNRSVPSRSFLAQIKRGFLIYYYGLSDFLSETAKEYSPFNRP